MSREDNIRVHESLFEALRAGDWNRFIGTFPADCQFNVFGQTPLSGTFNDRDKFFANGAEERATMLEPGGKFAIKSRILIADDRYSVGLMETKAMGTNGVPYEPQYVIILGFKNGKIVEYWEYFDTAVLEAVIFDNHLQKPRRKVPNPIDIMSDPAVEQ